MNQNINTAERNRQIILRLKELKEKRGLTNSMIEALTIEKGNAVSLTTIKRVFAEGSEDDAGRFNYNLTLRPLITAMDELPETPVILSTAASEHERQIATLQNIIQIKNIELEAYSNELDNLRLQLAKAETDSQKKVDFLKDQIDFKEGQMEEKDRQLKARDKQLDERADFLRQKDVELGKAFKEVAAYKKVSQILFAAFLVAVMMALVVEPLIPLFA